MLGEDEAMRPSVRYLAVAVAVVGVGLIAVGGAARAETWKLELKRLEPVADASTSGPNPPADWVYRQTGVQPVFFGFFDAETPDENAQAFAKIVKKEPAKYQSERPLRGAVQLGSDQYAFVLDMKDAKSKLYDRLYFDQNHNGDLTDDKVIEGAKPQRAGLLFLGAQDSLFPRVDLTIHVDGAKTDCSFFPRASSVSGPGFSFVHLSLTAASYRVGEITLDGKKHTVALLDHNGNGRFDDAIGRPEKVQTPEGEIDTAPIYGDALLLDPQNAKPRQDVFGEPAIDCQQWLSKLARIGDRYYDLKVAPAGDQITLTPSKVPIGYLTNPHQGLAAVMWGDAGLVQTVKGGSKPVAMPEGEWRLLSYTIEVQQDSPPAASPEKRKDAAEKKPTGKEKPAAERKDADKEPVKIAFLGTIVRLMLGVSGPDDESRMGPAGYSVVSAHATKECKPVTVRQGQTVTLPFGPPYRPVVTASYNHHESGRAALWLALVGSGGEEVAYMLVDGRRPPAPEFAISTVKGDVVKKDRFEYG